MQENSGSRHPQLYHSLPGNHRVGVPGHGTYANWDIHGGVLRSALVARDNPGRRPIRALHTRTPMPNNLIPLKMYAPATENIANRFALFRFRELVVGTSSADGIDGDIYRSSPRNHYYVTACNGRPLLLGIHPSDARTSIRVHVLMPSDSWFDNIQVQRYSLNTFCPPSKSPPTIEAAGVTACGGNICLRGS